MSTARVAWRLLAVACITAALVSTSDAACPKRCMCQKKIIRCMHLLMERVPSVHSDTIILDLRFNKIRDVLPGEFGSLRYLSHLMMNFNHLVMLRADAFQGLYSLKHLYLYKNKIHHIDDDAFRGLKNLQQLYLQGNEIEHFNKEVFANLPSLERLFLQNNMIKRIPAGTFDGLTSLSRLRLDGNSIICDCSIIPLMNMLNNSNNHNKPSLQAAATCHSPMEMRGMSIASMDKSSLHCEEPIIRVGPKDVEVNFGGTAFFTCQVSGDPFPEVVWMKDSLEIPYSDPRYQVLNNGTLKIERPNQNDVGAYECMAKNPLGEIKSREARMIVQNNVYDNEEPEFTVIPNDQVVNVGERSVTFQCKATGSPNPYITWHHNEDRIGLTNKIKLDSDGSLTISDIDKSDAGNYRCEAKNINGKIFTSADLTVHGAPSIVSLTQTPSPIIIGGQVSLKCETEGSPTPIVSWYKDNDLIQRGQRIQIQENNIKISALRDTDSGYYLCRAENSVGFIEEKTELIVERNLRKPPRLIYKPYDVETILGSKIELPCRSEGYPIPAISWKKDGSHIFRSTRHRVSSFGSLYITNVTEQDSGRYECTAANEIGRDVASCLLSIKELSLSKPGDKFVKIAFAEATREVDSAINQTINSLFGNRDIRSNMGDLYRLIRFPSAPTRELARAGEVYERTLVNIRKHVNAGKAVNNTSDFSYKELLSPDHLSLVAKLSGCISHRLHTNCTNICFNAKYRSIDGTCNNIQNPTWGASNTGFRRLLKPIYENGFSQPVGWTKGIKYNGFDLPSSRLVSSKLIATNEITPDSSISHMVMQWGQFLDHDLDHATPSVSSQSWDGIDCKKSCDYAAPCFPIDIPKGDLRVGNRRCLDFIRSSSVCGSGLTSVFFEEVQPREQINQLTTFIDGSQVYGFDENVARDLRNLTSDDGLLRNGPQFPGRKPLLPYSSGTHEMDCRKGALESDVKCFAAGDIRANEQVGLISMHTLWLREHNRIALELRYLNPHWNGDVIYHEARKIVGAQMQHFTYTHWLPIILGPSGMSKLGSFKKYDPTLNPTIANVFATAALRFGHSLINPVLQRLNNNFEEIAEGHLPLHKAFFASWRVVEEGGVDPLLRGLFTVPAKLKTPGQNLNTELTEKLFEVAHAVALDLAAMNIQRSRDHAIPFYSEWRKFCNMTPVNSFDDLQTEISDAGVRQKLKELYGSVHNVDVWVGGILEDQVPGGKVGPLFQCLLIDQFRRLRDGDRFWYENPQIFKPEQLIQIQKSSLSRILCDNGDKIDKITNNVFFIPESQGGFIECDELSSMDLLMWTDCTDCDGGFCSTSDSTTASSRRNRRDISNMIKPDTSKDSESTSLNQQLLIEKYEETIKSFEKRFEEIQSRMEILEKSCIKEMDYKKT